jgi:hypothetical protein
MVNRSLTVVALAEEGEAVTIFVREAPCEIFRRFNGKANNIYS